MESSNNLILELSQDYLEYLMVRMAHHSTAIEGNSLSQGETKSILIDRIEYNQFFDGLLRCHYRVK